jgi:hypothetical protein
LILATLFHIWDTTHGKKLVTPEAVLKYLNYKLNNSIEAGIQ